jgi:hypothetical protein
VPRMLRNAKCCAADPGSIVQVRSSDCFCGASYRTMLRIAGGTLHRARDTRSRERYCRLPAPDAAQRLSGALLIRGPRIPELSRCGSRICVASFNAAPRPGHQKRERNCRPS